MVNDSSVWYGPLFELVAFVIYCRNKESTPAGRTGALLQLELSWEIFFLCRCRQPAWVFARALRELFSVRFFKIKKIYEEQTECPQQWEV